MSKSLDVDALRRFFLEAQSTAMVTDPRVRQWAGFAAALIFALAIPAAAVTRHIPRAQRGVLLDVEFAASAERVRALVPADLREAVVRTERDDSLLLIPTYWALFTATGMVLVRSRGRINRACGVAVIIIVTIAALCDLFENLMIVAALTPSAPFEASPAPWAVAKWRLLFTTAAALSVPLLTRSRHLLFHANLTAVIFAIAGLRGLWASVFRQADDPWAVITFAVALFFLGLLFVWDPDFFAKPS